MEDEELSRSKRLLLPVTKSLHHVVRCGCFLLLPAYFNFGKVQRSGCDERSSQQCFCFGFLDFVELVD
jgi:hypothetical protein